MGFRTLGERLVHSGRLVSLSEVSLEGPDGELFDREVVRHPGAVAVVPYDRGTVLLVRQYRAAVGSELLEIPAGKRDLAGEEPEVTARRELQEEVGVRCGRLERMAQLYNSPGFCDETVLLYLAQELEPVESRPQGVEERHMEVVRMPLEEAVSSALSGGILDAKTIVGLFEAREMIH